MRRCGLPGPTVPDISGTVHPAQPRLFMGMAKREVSNVIEAYHLPPLRRWLQDAVALVKDELTRWADSVTAAGA